MSRLRRFLCAIGIHRWDFAGIDLIPTGAYKQCRYCGKQRYQSWV